MMITHNNKNGKGRQNPTVTVDGETSKTNSVNPNLDVPVVVMKRIIDLFGDVSLEYYLYNNFRIFMNTTEEYYNVKIDTTLYPYEIAIPYSFYRNNESLCTMFDLNQRKFDKAVDNLVKNGFISKEVRPTAGKNQRVHKITIAKLNMDKDLCKNVKSSEAKKQIAKDNYKNSEKMKNSEGMCMMLFNSADVETTLVRNSHDIEELKMSVRRLEERNEEMENKIEEMYTDIFDLQIAYAQATNTGWEGIL